MLQAGESLASFQVSPTSATVNGGDVLALRVTGVTTDGRAVEDFEVSWTVQDPVVARVTKNYAIQGLAQGSTNIIFERDGLVTDPVQVTVPGDPLLEQQWHLLNTGQVNGFAGIDIGVKPVWDEGNRAQDVLVAVVDDGVESAHPDLKSNIRLPYSWNYLTFRNDPTGGIHGTSVAGLIAARDSNGAGGVGVASRVGLAAFNLLERYSTANESDAMTRHMADIAVSSNSWGAEDGTGELYRSAGTWREAVARGVHEGRGGLGVVYVWAGGNGGMLGRDNSNYDGQANNRHVIAVTAVGDDGVHASYSERGANLWLSAPSRGNSGHGLVTTDRMGQAGYNLDGSWDLPDVDYTRHFGGTSAATPLVSGVAALVIQARPSLSWRDVRVILAASARQNHANHEDWRVNGAGYAINHQYGFGLIDAQAAVALAKRWTPLGPEVIHDSPLQWVNLPIPDDNEQGVSHGYDVPVQLRVEWVEVVFDASGHGNQGDLTVVLKSPDGTDSVLAQTHACSQTPCASRYINWVFGSARHLGESSLGTWTLTVSDRQAGYGGDFRSWKLRIYGVSQD